MAGVDVGTGGSITLGTQGGTYKITRIAGLEHNGVVVDTTHLGTTTQRTKMSGDLYENGPVAIDVLFECNVGLPSVNAAAETITLTYPKKTGITTAAKIAGTGFISSRRYGTMELEGVMTGGFTIQFDGETDATFTAES